MRHLHWLSLAGIASCGFCALAEAAPAPAVARVSYVQGDASYLPAGLGNTNAWSALGINTPLMTGYSVYTPQDSRAEIELGLGNVVQMNQGTEADLVNLSSGVTQIGVSSGDMDLRVRGLPANAVVEVDTPEAAATAQTAGSYRIRVGKNWASYGVVFGGLSVAVNGQQVTVPAGESVELTNGQPITYSIVPLGTPSLFDSWAARRDAQHDHSASARYVNNQVLGYQGLGQYGRWSGVPAYGNVWIPDVPPGWAPYREGRWVWEGPYGWTWVSYEPWGWAPYHYGRWVYADYHWCWVPPPPPWYTAPVAVMAITPVYAPALVAFIGGPGWGAALSVGGPVIGWVPLAVGEPYYYPWQSRPAVVNVHYTNITVVNAVTVVNKTTFVGGPVVPLHVNPAMLMHAPILGTQPRGVLPDPASLAAYPQRRLPPMAIPPAVIVNRPLIARITPPPPPKPFSAVLRQVRATGHPIPPLPHQRPVARPLVAPVVQAGQKPFRSAFAHTPGGPLKAVGPRAIATHPRPMSPPALHPVMSPVPGGPQIPAGVREAPGLHHPVPPPPVYHPIHRPVPVYHQPPSVYHPAPSPGPHPRPTYHPMPSPVHRPVPPVYHQPPLVYHPAPSPGPHPAPPPARANNKEKKKPPF